MTKRIYVAPAAGKEPRSPFPPYEEIPAEGYGRTDAPAWHRLKKFGDVVITDQAPQPPVIEDAPAARANKSKS